jgi:hypothetical protein
MLRAVGFTRVEMITPPKSTAYRAARAVVHYLKGKNRLSAAFRQDRAVFHAYRK